MYQAVFFSEDPLPEAILQADLNNVDIVAGEDIIRIGDDFIVSEERLVLHNLFPGFTPVVWVEVHRIHLINTNSQERTSEGPM